MLLGSSRSLRSGLVLTLSTYLQILIFEGSYVDSTWSTFLTNLFDKDSSAPKVLGINESKPNKGFIRILSPKTNEPSYTAFQQFIECRNFGKQFLGYNNKNRLLLGKYFDYIRRTELYKLTQRAVGMSFVETNNSIFVFSG